MRELDRSRRGFLKASAIAGLTVIIAPLGSRAFAALFEEKILTPIQWDTASGSAKRRARGRHAALAEPAIACIHVAYDAG
jgi:hypothetical protein